MRNIEITVSDDTARTWEWLLRLAYGKDGRTGLERLCRIAIETEVAKAAQALLDAIKSDTDTMEEQA